MLSQQIEKSQFTKIRPLDDKFNKGIGTFGNTYEGTFMGGVVAIKKYNLGGLQQHLHSSFDIYKEASHPNILKFYGVSCVPFYAIFELAPHSLATFYANFPLSWENIYNFGNQIANGMNFLSSKKINHKHLKSNNIFVTNELVIKLADFGLSKVKLECSSNGESTVRWRAPETLTREYARIKDDFDVVQKTDVYSYGLILWEMRARKKPFSTYDETSVVQLLSMGTIETIEFSWPNHFKKLLRNCWNVSPYSRPDFKTIIDTFTTSDFDIKNANLAPVQGYLYGNCASLIDENARLRKLLEELKTK